MSEFDRIYSEKWEELIKSNVSPTEANIRAHVYAEEITGTFVDLPVTRFEAFDEDDGDQGWSNELYENMEFEKVDECYGE